MSRVSRGVNLLSLSLFLFLFPIFPVFSFFATKKINGERLCKKRVFSSFEFLRTFYEVYGCIRAVFSSFLSRARSPDNARTWRGQGSDDVSSSRAKLVFCLGSQILSRSIPLSIIHVLECFLRVIKGHRSRISMFTVFAWYKWRNCSQSRLV